MIRRLNAAICRAVLASLLAVSFNPDDGFAWPPQYDEEGDDEPMYDVVIITGEAHNGDWGLLSWGGNGATFYIDQLAPEEMLAIVLDPRKDVRCSPANQATRTTTSQHGTDQRWLAANEMARIYLAGLTEGQRSSLLGRHFRITYADGVSERWQILHPVGSIVLHSIPVPGMVPGSGLPEPGPACN